MVMMMIIDGTVVEHWSRTQATRALSSSIVRVLRRCHGSS